MKEVKKYLMMAGCTMVLSMVSLSAKAVDLKTLTDLAKDEARISTSIPVDNNIDVNTAFRMATTKKVPVIDVRTIQEYQFVGHIPFAYNIPVQVWGEKWDEKKNCFALDQNSGFISNFERIFPDKSAAYIISCRSGHRSTKAIDALAKDGYTNLYNMWEGFEGAAVKDKELPSFDQKVGEGWKNKGLPFTWNIDPKLISSKI